MVKASQLFKLGSGVAAISFAMLPFQPAEPAQKAQTPSVQKDVVPFMNKYCSSCHDTNEPPAGINPLLSKTDQDFIKNAAHWKRIIRALKSETMPPAGMPRPTHQEVKDLIRAVNGIMAKGPADPGKVTLRRLNRAEYRYTIQDLLGINYDPTTDFPNDDVGEGFDNIGEVLSVSPLLVEKYLEAAENIAERAIITFQPKTYRTDSNDLIGTDGQTFLSNGDKLLMTNGSVTAKPKIASPGTYRVKFKGYGMQAGPEVVKVRVNVNGKPIQTLEIKAIASKPLVYEIPVELNTGEQNISVEFFNDYWNPNAKENDRDRNFVISYIEVYGPLGEPEQLPSSHQALIPRKPAPGQELEVARASLSKFATKAFRRPVEPKELDRILAIVKNSLNNKESFEQSMRNGLTAILVSPQFLFRPETASKQVRALNDYEIATRLSYFLWSSTPDDELLGLAALGKLKEPKTLQAQVARMKLDPKINRLGEQFATQWLQLKKLDSIVPDTNIYKKFNRELRRNFRTETLLFFNDIVKNDKSILNFLDSKTTFVNQQLAEFYGWNNVRGREFKEVQIPDANRGGLLGQASVLMLTSNPTRTSPTKRGKWILEQFLGAAPPPPPPGVPDLPDKKVDQAKNLRERMAQHRSDPNCYSCHQMMDPLGFSLENFDAIGSWRTKDGEEPIDASGELPDGTKVNGLKDVKNALFKRKDEFVRTLTAQMLTFALGRGLTPADEVAIEKIALEVEQNGYKMSALINGIVKSEPFTQRGKE